MEAQGQVPQDGVLLRLPVTVMLLVPQFQEQRRRLLVELRSGVGKNELWVGVEEGDRKRPNNC